MQAGIENHTLAENVDRTPTRTTHLCTYSVSQNAVRKYRHSSREHAWLKSFALVCQKQYVIPASCLTCCRTCHRAPLHDLSHRHHLSSDLLRSQWPVLSRPILDWSMKPCETHGGVAETRNLHLPQVMSPRWRNLAISSLKKLSWTQILGKIFSFEELSSKGILGQIRVKYRNEFWEMTIKILAQKIRRRLANLMSTCPTSNQGYTRTTIQLKTLQTRILKMENYENMLASPLNACGRGENYGSSQRPIVSGKPEAKSRTEEVQIVFKVITLEERA